MQHRVAFLDGLRATAVLAVIAFHAASHSPASVAAMPHPAVVLLQQGCHGVDLFFVISGFCLAYPFLARARMQDGQRLDVCAFAARRIVRILPPYAAALGVMLAIAAACAFLRIPLPASMPQHGFTLSDVLRQALFLDAGTRLLNGSFWTLAVEFRWYFLFPVALWLWLRSSKAFFAVMAALALAAVSTRAQSVDLAVLPSFLSGIVAAHLYLAGHAMLRRLALPFAAVALTLAAVVAPTPSFSWSFSPLWGLAAFSCVVAAASVPALRTLLSVRALAGIGTLSYGIYLVHEPFTSLAHRLAPNLAGWPAWLLAFCAALGAGTAFAALAERPFTREPLRGTLLAPLEPALASIFGRLGIGRFLPLEPGAAQRASERAAA